jgi:PhnB protein
VVEIGVPVETVWQALTTPEGLRQFYCDWAEISPGVGGTFQIGWHAGSLPPAEIEAWEPNRRLRLAHNPPPGSGHPAMAEEWILQGEGGSTVVRLVYEGFGPGDDWDDFYDSFEATATLVLDLLHLWLDRHGGAPLGKSAVVAPVDATPGEAWVRALGPDLTDAAGAPAGAEPGTPVRVPLPGGEPLTGTVVHVAPGDEAVVDVPDLGARFVLCARPGTTTRARLILETYAYGQPADRVAAMQDRLDRAAAALSPPDRSRVQGGHDMTDTSGYQPANSHTVTPYLAVSDAGRAIDFYVEAFGATETGERFVDPDGRIGHAEITIGDSVVYLSDEYPRFGATAPTTLGGTAVAMTVYVPDVDASVAAAERAGATVEGAIEETFYGTRRATLTDPFGHRWMVGTHVRDVSAEEYKKALDDFAESGA